MFKKSAMAVITAIGMMVLSVPVMAGTKTPANIPVRPVLYSVAVDKNDNSAAAMNKTMYVTADMLFVRSIPSTMGEVIGTFNRGDSVRVTGRAAQNDEGSGWFRVAVNNTEGFVSAEFLSDTAPIIEAPAADPAVYATAAPAAVMTDNTAASTSPNGAPIVKTSYVYALSGTLVQINKDANGNWADFNGTGLTWVTDNEAVTEGGEVLTSYDPTPIPDMAEYLQTVMEEA